MPSRGVLGDLMNPLRFLLESELEFISSILLIVLHIFSHRAVPRLNTHPS